MTIKRKSTADSAQRQDGINPVGDSRFVSHNLTITAFEKAPHHVLFRYAHAHTQYEFFLPLTPVPFLQVDSVSYLGEVGWAYAAPCGHVHGVRQDVADIAFYRIEIEQQYFDALLSDMGYQSPFPIRPFRCSEELRFYIEAFKREAGKGALTEGGKLRHLSALICCELISDGMGQSHLPTPPNAGYQRGIRATAVFMNNHYHQQISLEELAKMCGFSRNYYTACFREVYGVTPLAYLTKLRISKAKQLLETTNDPIREIALTCGYSKTNTFTQAFRSVAGKNPSAYRSGIR